MNSDVKRRRESKTRSSAVNASQEQMRKKHSSPAYEQEVKVPECPGVKVARREGRLYIELDVYGVQASLVEYHHVSKAW